MNKIRVIDLLNKIANGEDVPKKIKWGVHNLTWFVYEYKALDELGDPNIFECIGSISHSSLNEEVEIIENTLKEDKKIEKMEFCYEVADKMQNANNERFRDFINEIIDRLNGE